MRMNTQERSVTKFLGLQFSTFRADQEDRIKIVNNGN